MGAPETTKWALDLPSRLAYVYAPVSRLLKKLRVTRAGARHPNPRDVLLPAGYSAEVVATGFTAPVHCTFDDQGGCYVCEAGHKTDTRPCILKVDVATGMRDIVLEISEDRWFQAGALTGAYWHANALYFSNTDSLSRLTPDGNVSDIVTGLPGLGDHQVNYPVVGPDGKIYFGVGSATNAGVVGADNYAYGWLPQFPTFHDVPARDVILAGHNYPFRNVLGSVTDEVHTGAFVPFGTETKSGQIIPGNVKCSGAILRCDLDGANLEVVAWGLRNPFGIAFAPDGQLYATEHGIDERGGRYIVGDYDDFYRITSGTWYGWPDFASGIRLDDPHWGEGGQGRDPTLAEHPDAPPPKPLALFDPHVGANGVDFCRNPGFGFEGDAFVALFGDLAPITVPRITTPRGFKIVRIDMRTHSIVDFAINRVQGPASKLPHEGFERPSHCAFGPDGALYVVDWGEIEIAPEQGGVRMKRESGVLWRIRRTGEAHGEVPAKQMVVPLYSLQLATLIAVVAAGVTALVGVALFWRRRHRKS